MNIMKKYFLLILLAGFFTLASCSSDDDGNDFERNIVATWNLTAVEPPLLDFSECSTNPTITFEEDETTEWTFYNADNDCEPETDTGMWNQNTGSNYTVTIPGFGSFDGTVEFQSENEFIFTSSYQTIPVVLYFEK